MESLNFKLFSLPVQQKFEELCQYPEELFLVSLSSQSIWEKYLESFPKEVNGIFRERASYDCNCCKNFINRIGAIVRIQDNVITDSVWNIETEGYYQDVTKQLHKIVTNSKPLRKFLLSESTAGSLPNIDNYNQNIVWDHFYVKIPNQFVIKSTEMGRINSDFNSTFSLFERAMKELSLEAAEQILDLIDSNSIYRGQEHKHTIEFFIRSKKVYDALPEEKRHNYIMTQSVIKQNYNLLRLKNSVIGTLLDDLSKDVDLETAVRSFESKVSPLNYQRTTAIVTPKMIKEAQNTINALGYESSLYRKQMTVAELPLHDILWKGDTTKSLNVFDDVSLAQEQRAVKENIKKFKAKPLTMTQLIENVLPTAQECQILFNPKLQNNLLTLTNSVDKDSKLMFKWDNNVAWSYNGDVTDRIKERVKSAGGDVEGDLRVSLSWSNSDDLDLHCYDDGGSHVYFNGKRAIPGMYLDLDMNGLDKHDSEHPVENIIIKDKSQLKPGIYKFVVHQYDRRNNNKVGFTIQVEFDGVTHSFSYEQLMKKGEKITCFKIKFDGTNFEILDVNGDFTSTSDISSTEIWGVETNTFVPISNVILSPNFWGENKVGNKHFIFLVDNMFNNQKVRTFYSEYLNSELTPVRKTMELLGALDNLKAEPVTDQASGFGFSETSKSEFVIRVKDKNNSTNIYNVTV